MMSLEPPCSEGTTCCAVVSRVDAVEMAVYVFRRVLRRLEAGGRGCV
jgi:hypothetical protein